MTTQSDDPIQDDGASQGDDSSAGDDVAVLQNDLAAVQAEADRLKDLAARAQADLQNAKGRMEKEAADIRSFAVAGLIEKLLPTIDNFQRAFSHLPEELQDNEWVQGLQAVEQAMMADLSSVGFAKMECIGQVADPLHHEVLQIGDGPKDEVVEVFEDGYTLNGKVLRVAKVMVGQG